MTRPERTALAVHRNANEMLGNRIITVSLHPLMTPEENEYIAAALSEVVARLRKM